uniref:Uncharacterized protein n=1 Tax=Arundo donax TaxID=35708 RepID=A0A0A8YGD5_ARUDO
MLDLGKLQDGSTPKRGKRRRRRCPCR